MKRESETSRMPGNALLLGKSELSPAAPTGNGHANLDPTAEGSQVAADWRGSVASVILACARIKNALLTFGEDRGLLDAFLAALVDGHVLSRAEAKLGRAAPKLSKLVKIGEHADRLRREEIFQLLVPSYTTIYHVTVLFDRLPKGDEERRIEELACILAKCPGEISREFLIEQTRLLKVKARPKRSMAKGAPAARVEGAPSDAQKPRALIEAGEEFDLLVLTPRKKDLAHLRADYSDASTLARCLPLHRLTADGAAAIIMARILDVAVIESKLLPLCGFPRLSRVLLARRPTFPDVTDAEVIITAERGEMRLNSPEDESWLDDAGPIDPLEVAARLCPAASRRLHVFAAAQAEGWSCLVGDDSWAEEPSL
jgi:hypothetical protein